MTQHALLIGNSDGIGLATTKRLLEIGWDVTGISRSSSAVESNNYNHHIANVGDKKYQDTLNKVLSKQPFNLCIYLVGIGELIDLNDMKKEPGIIDVNFTGMVKTAASIIPRMISTGQGHFIGISSVADELLSREAPSYHASKAGFSSYIRSLALSLKKTDVFITNIRFGFVDTKMAKGDIRPFMMSVEKAVDHIEKCIYKRPDNYTAPKIVIPLIKFRKWMMKLGAA